MIIVTQPERHVELNDLIGKEIGSKAKSPFKLGVVLVRADISHRC